MPLKCLFFIGKGKSFTPRPADRSRRGKPVMLFAFIVISSQQLSLSCPQPADRSGQRPVQTLLFVWRACGLQQPPLRHTCPTLGLAPGRPPPIEAGGFSRPGCFTRGRLRKEKRKNQLSPTTQRRNSPGVIVTSLKEIICYSKDSLQK